MAQKLEQYLNDVRAALEISLNLRNYPSLKAERQYRPEVEAQDVEALLLPPITIVRKTLKGESKEKTLVESSINSCRENDDIDHLVKQMFTRFLMYRADQFSILRKVPIPSYDLSFLITNRHLEQMSRPKIIDFIIQFMQDIDKEISEMRLTLNIRGRIAATNFVTALSK